MKNSKVIESNGSFERVRYIANELYYQNDFPDIVFKNENWLMFFLESWNIFDENQFETFVFFLEEMDEREFFLSSNEILGYDALDYIKSVVNSKTNYTPIIQFSAEVQFEEFDEIQHKYMFRNAIDAFLFSKSKKWGIYNNSNLDIMILGFSSEIESVVEKYYKNNEDRITSIKVLLNDLENCMKLEKIYESRFKTLKNYSSKF